MKIITLKLNTASKFAQVSCWSTHRLLVKELKANVCVQTHVTSRASLGGVFATELAPSLRHRNDMVLIEAHRYESRTVGRTGSWQPSNTAISNILANQCPQKIKLRYFLLMCSIVDTKSGNLHHSDKLYQLAIVPLFTTNTWPKVIEISVKLIYSTHIGIVSCYGCRLFNTDFSLGLLVITRAECQWLLT